MNKHKYIQQRIRGNREEYLIIFPQKLYATRTLTVKGSLAEALSARNEWLGFDPDAREQPELVQTQRAPVVHTIESLSFGALGDTHLGSRYERLDIINSLYDRYAAEGVKYVFHTGNWIEGEAPFNRYDLLTSGLDGQLDYFVANYPQRPGITTYFISGDDHEGWMDKNVGSSIGRLAQDRARAQGRDDLVYIGYIEGRVQLMIGDYPVNIRLIHPGGGSALAVSLKGQRVVEAMDIHDLPDLILIGHYHKADYLPSYRGVAAIQTGCCVDQSPFMRKKGVVAHLGGWFITCHVGLNGLARPVFAAEYMSFAPRIWKFKDEEVLILD